MNDRLTSIVFHPRPSRQLSLILGCLECLTLVFLIIAPIPLSLRFLLFSLLLLQALYSHSRLHGASPQRITEVRINDQYGVRLVFVNGQVMQTSLRGDSLIMNGLLLLRFDGEGILRRPSLLLGRDSLSAEELRRLRVLLRMSGRTAAV
jgi:hypothetical protein